MVRLPRLLPRKPEKTPAAAEPAPVNPKAEAPADNIVRPLAAMIVAEVALRTGQALLRKGVVGGLLGRQAAKVAGKKGGSLIKGRTMGQTLIGTALARVATSSVPGAIAVGGGLLAKTLYDRKQARTAKAQAPADASGKPPAKPESDA